MKNWFNNLDNKYKILIHIVLCLAFFIMPSCIGDNTNAFIYIIWLAILVFEIIFIVLHIQNKKQNSSKTEENNNAFVDKGKSSPPKPIIAQKTEIANNEEKYMCDLELKLDNTEISNFLKTFIDGGWYTKDEIYEGMTNKEIEEAGYEVYQLNATTYDAEIRFFEGSNSIGVYVKDYYGKSQYFAVVPKEKRDDIRKIIFFNKDIQCSLYIDGGKYKEYDYEKEKVVIKDGEYNVKLFITYKEDQSSEEKMNEILELEKSTKKKLKVFATYIAGVTFNNEDGTNRKKILATLQQNEELQLEPYLYEGAKAVKILTKKGQMIGNIPKDYSEFIYNSIENNTIFKAYYNPEYYEGRISQHCVRILLK